MFNKGRRIEKTIGKKKAEIVLTNEARWSANDEGIILDVALDILPDASEYILEKVEGDRFTVVSEDLNIVVTGIVLYHDNQEVELLITNLYGDIYFVKSKDYHKID